MQQVQTNRFLYLLSYRPSLICRMTHLQKNIFIQSNENMAQKASERSEAYISLNQSKRRRIFSLSPTHTQKSWNTFSLQRAFSSFLFFILFLLTPLKGLKSDLSAGGSLLKYLSRPLIFFLYIYFVGLFLKVEYRGIQIKYQKHSLLSKQSQFIDLLIKLTIIQVFGSGDSIGFQFISEHLKGTHL